MQSETGLRTIAVSAANLVHHADDIDKYYRLRRRVFVDVNGWTGPTILGPYEVDFWDTPLAQATHFICLNRRNEAVGCARVISSVGMTMLETLFEKFLWEPHEKAWDVIEVHRVGIDPELNPADKQKVALLTSYSVINWALMNQIRRGLMITSAQILQQSPLASHLYRLGPTVDGYVACGSDYTKELGARKRYELLELGVRIADNLI